MNYKGGDTGAFENSVKPFFQTLKIFRTAENPSTALKSTPIIHEISLLVWSWQELEMNSCDNFCIPAAMG